MKAIRSILAIVALALSLSACSVFSGPGGIFSKGEKKSGADAQLEQKDSDAKTGKTGKTGKSDKKKHSSHKEASESRDDSRNEQKSSLAGHLDGEWVIVGVGESRLPQRDEMPYVYFEEKNDRFYASNGCNILNGDYRLGPDSKITFSSVLSTMMECGDDEWERAISAILKDGVSVRGRVEKKGAESYLYLDNRAGKRVMTLRKHNMEPLNGLWSVERIGREDVSGSGLDIFIDVAELKTHGNTGCNYFNGQIVIDPDMANSISFSHMGVTMRMCENSELERTYLVALEQTAAYSLVGKSLHLLNDRGQTVLVLKREQK